MARITDPNQDPWATGAYNNQHPNASGSGSPGPEVGPTAPGGGVGAQASPSTGIDLGSVANNQIDTSAPGASIDTSQADAERARMQQIMQSLQTQAQTGGGAWEQALQNSTGQANQSSMALGQSMPGQDAASMLRGIGNAQSANTQRAAGEANTLRAQTQQAARADLGTIGSATNTLDAQQAAEQAAARQAVRETNNQTAANDYNSTTGAISGAAQAIATVLSKGGQIPGKPKVFGDDEKNDTVPAMLSPGEIVIPRTVAQSDDPAGASARFVAAVKSRGNPQKLSPGGPVNVDNDGGDMGAGGLSPTGPAGGLAPATVGQRVTDPTTGEQTLSNDTSVTQGQGWNPLSGLLPGQTQENASTLNGGLLNNTNYNSSRTQNLANADALSSSSPSVAPQQTQNALDAATAAAMRGGRGGAANIQAEAAQQGATAAGAAGKTVAGESRVTQQQYANAIQQQRQQDLAFAQAQQQAEWRNTMTNSGIGLSQQNALRGLLGGVGQAAASASTMFGKSNGNDVSANEDTGTSDVIRQQLSAVNNSTPTTSGADTNTMVGDSENFGGYAFGGSIKATDDPKRAASFLKALRARKAA